MDMKEKLQFIELNEKNNYQRQPMFFSRNFLDSFGSTISVTCDKYRKNVDKGTGL